MKKVLSVILALSILLFSVPVFAEEAAFLGVWYLHGLIEGEETIDVASAGIYGSLTLNSNNTAAFDVAGVVSEGTWEYNGSELWITIENDPAQATFSDDEMQICGGEQILIFNREESSAIRLADINTNVTEEDFNGDWECALVSIGGIVLSTSQMDGADMMLPSLTFKDGKPTQTNDIESSLFEVTVDEDFPWEFNDGVYSCSVENDSFAIQFRVFLLQDGMLAYVVDTNGEEFGLYFNRVEAEPAE